MPRQKYEPNTYSHGSETVPAKPATDSLAGELFLDTGTIELSTACVQVIVREVRGRTIVDVYHGVHRTQIDARGDYEPHTKILTSDADARLITNPKGIF